VQPRDKRWVVQQLPSLPRKINEDLLAYFLRENGVSTGSAQGNGIDHAKMAFDELCKGSV
jgi:hypothetical protein